MSKRLDEIEARLWKIEKENDNILKMTKESLELVKAIIRNSKLSADGFMDRVN